MIGGCTNDCVLIRGWGVWQEPTKLESAMTDYGPGPCETCGEDIEAHTARELTDCIVDYPRLEKACDFIAACDEANWDWSWDEHSDENTTHVRAERDPELIEVRWNGKRLEHVLYSHDGENFRNLPTVAAARSRLTGEPLEPPKRGRPKTETNEDGSENGDIRILPRILPFDIATAYDDEIIDAVRGRKVIWWNTILLGYDSAQVLPARQRHIYVEESITGRAILTFISPQGFRSVALDCLVQIR